jgi:hypothetical protein
MKNSEASNTKQKTYYQGLRTQLDAFCILTVIKKIINYKSNFLDHWDTNKNPNVLIFGIKDSAEIQNKGMENQFSELKAEKFPNIGKDMDTQEQETFRTPHIHDQERTSPCYIIVKMPRNH